MAMFTSRRLLKAVAIGTVGLGTLASLRVNEYDIGAIGIVRLGRAALTVLDIGRYYKRELFDSKLDKMSPEYLQLKSNAHKYGAQKLLELCCANKGVYIKVGQHIGALDYLLPQEYVHTMRVLHSAAPQSSFNDVLTVIKEDFKRSPYEIFQSIDPEPLGTASLAQVHRAVLKNGDVVAVKVQHRAVKSNSYIDIKTMSTLVSITSLIFPDFKFDWLVKETKRNIPQELNFTLTKNILGLVVIPRAYNGVPGGRTG
ncbi:putative aarF domain-containing protein kinase 1 [Trachymyrmex zeteki]|uniref:Putative aarF domain-containing protein kinase 1 n=1 Tax=Mycetomoellerius zeteki TaxID=64791 RepID=A0A151WR75_9HYME|nr:putative aarF domain-containing protein kinase 1 [Trachymyrmex zeteki]